MNLVQVGHDRMPLMTLMRLLIYQTMVETSDARYFATSHCRKDQQVISNAAALSDSYSKVLTKY